MKTIKLVVTGPVGAGKSTFIRTVSDIDVVDTDRLATDKTKNIKETTTVAFDFGQLQFGPNMSLHLYGTPGQTRFDFVWETLITKADAYILLVAANRPSEFHNARSIYKFMNEQVELPMILGVTHLDCEHAWSLNNVAVLTGFRDKQNRPPIIALNTSQPESVINALSVLISQYKMYGQKNQYAK